MKNGILKSSLIIIAGFLLCGVVFSGCSVAKPAEEAVEEVLREPEVLMTEEAAAPMEKAEASAEEVLMEEATYSSDLPSFERKVIKNAYIEVEIESGKFEDILFKIASLAEQNGGFISNTQSYSDSEGKLTSGRITVRIPQDKFNLVVDKVKSFGTVKSIQISGHDVTEEYVDLESRLKNLKAQEEVLLDLMEKSKSVKDSIEVQRELSNVQGEIEVIKGRMNYLDNMVAFSTVEVFLYEPEPIKTTPGWGLVDALKRGLRGAIKVLNGMIFFFILISPIIVLALVVWLIVRAIIRARKKRKAMKE